MKRKQPARERHEVERAQPLHGLLGRGRGRGRQGLPRRQRPDQHVDALAARLVLAPQQLDVVVASNLFGDILTDLGGALQGSLGLPPSGNIDPTGRHPSLFEPVHGSAPGRAGQGTANPMAAIWAASMMLDQLGEPEAAALVMRRRRARRA